VFLFRPLKLAGSPFAVLSRPQIVLVLVVVLVLEAILSLRDLTGPSYEAAGER
jgi:hypothetical protein